jgi:glycosyltransferase involved in cell wall biosynthesis
MKLYTDLKNLSPTEVVHHYKCYGKNEGRFGSEKQISDFVEDPTFDIFSYMKLYTDLQNLSPAEVAYHYKYYGKNKGKNKGKIKHIVNDELDIEFYRNSYPELTGMEKTYLDSHYHKYGIIEGRFGSKNSFTQFIKDNNLDLGFYRTNYKELNKFTDIQLAHHYKNYGINNGFFGSMDEVIKFVKEKNIDLYFYKNNYEHFKDFTYTELAVYYKKFETIENLKNSLNHTFGETNKKEEDNYINIIGYKKFNNSFTDIMNIMERYYLKLGKNVKIYDISEIQETYFGKYNIICINPFDINDSILTKFIFKPIALWFWEYKSIPSIFKNYENYFSKIYVASEFNLEIFSKTLSIPVEKITITSKIHEYLDIIPNHTIVNNKVKDVINSTNNKIRYGFCFNLNSSIVRKNVLNLVKAFEMVRDSNKVLILKIKGICEEYDRKVYEEFIKIVNNNDNIYLIDEEIDILDLYKLYSFFDYYISPHSGEGFGLTIYDNMILGNVIISTYYSGEKDFLKKEEIIELEYEEKEIYELKDHITYGQMSEFKGAFVSVDNIYKCIEPEIKVDDYILYFVHLTCRQDFNTGIQKVTRDLSVELNKKKKIILIKYCNIKNDFVLINSDELKIFTKYGGINHIDENYTYLDLKHILNNIKYKKSSFFMAEILYFNDYELFNKIISLTIVRDYNSSNIFHDDCIYYADTIIKEERELWFKKYIENLSNVKNVIPISEYSKKCYLSHKESFNINTLQNVNSVKLGVVNKNNLCNDNINDIKKNYQILCNISKHSRKNYDNLIKAFIQFHKIYKNYKLIIFGNGWENNFDKINNIEYRAFIEEKTKIDLYKNSDFSVYPSLMEGYGLPIYESLIQGCPVICHNETSTLEISNDINLACVSAVNCKNVNVLFKEMEKFSNTKYLLNIINTIKNVKFKTYQEYGNEVYNIINPYK